MTCVRLVLAAMLAAWASAASALAPLEAYGRLPNIETAAIAPGGERLAVIWTDGEGRKIVIQDLRIGKVVRVLVAGDKKVRALQWADDNHLLVTVSTTARAIDVIAPRREYFMAFDYDMAKARMRPLMGDVGQSMNVIYGRPEIRILDGKPYAFIQGVHFVSNRGRLSLFKVDLQRAAAELDQLGFQDTYDWVVSPEGRAVAQATYDGKSARWSLKVRQGAGWNEVKTLQAYSEWPNLAGLGRDGKSVLVVDMKDGRNQMREVSVAQPAWTEPFAAQDANAGLWDPARHNLIGFYALTGEEDRYTYFDPADEKVWAMVLRAFPQNRVTLVSSSADRKRFVVLVDSPTEGPAYALIDLNTKRADWLGRLYQGLGVEDISPVRKVRYRAADGLELTGYLTLPRGREAKNLPLVVHPHGGPAVRDGPGFDWWAQAMASRGYAVLQVNYRGSDGFGWDFLAAGFGQWGRKMQTDLSDGVRHLAKEGTIDPKRVCIVGASYGGYAALAGPSLDPGVYRCAVSVAGLSDARRFVAWSKRQDGLPAQRWWTRFMGAEDPRDPVLTQISPIAHIDRIDAPILLIHGRDDTTVPLEQSQVMADALRKAGKPVELVVQPGSDHWLSRGDTRLAMLEAVMAFLEKHNPAD